MRIGLISSPWIAAGVFVAVVVGLFFIVMITVVAATAHVASLASLEDAVFVIYTLVPAFLLAIFVAFLRFKFTERFNIPEDRIETCFLVIFYVILATHKYNSRQFKRLK